MNPPFSSLSASMFDRANRVQINGARFNNRAGNSTLDNSYSNVFVYVKQDSGIGFRSVVILLLLGFLFFLLL